MYINHQPSRDDGVVNISGDETVEQKLRRIRKEINDDAKTLGKLYDQYFQMEKCGICALELSQHEIILFENDDKLMPFLSSPETNPLIGRMQKLSDKLTSLHREVGRSPANECDIAYLNALFVEIDRTGLLRDSTCICLSCAKKIGFTKFRNRRFQTASQMLHRDEIRSVYNAVIKFFSCSK
jgi:hypothetical protein